MRMTGNVRYKVAIVSSKRNLQRFSTCSGTKLAEKLRENIACIILPLTFI